MKFYAVLTAPAVGLLLTGAAIQYAHTHTDQRQRSGFGAGKQRLIRFHVEEARLARLELAGSSYRSGTTSVPFATSGRRPIHKKAKDQVRRSGQRLDVRVVAQG